ncbi:MAG: GTPase ObgE [Lentisphaeria bacterium]|nr:GTPase ObgE [Lentisphaeria bacterium]
MFVDKVTIRVIAGKGGNGCCSFRREKFIPKGGPDGGDGGDGGSVYLEASTGEQSLVSLVYQTRYRAQNGPGGRGAGMHGRNADDITIKVPVGTVVTDCATREVLGDLDAPGARLLVARGGRGGRGNARFATSTNRVPRYAEPGTEGEEKELFLELKIIADGGLVGYPNAGKSTLLGALSAARPKVAPYPFTTLHPVVGVVEFDYPDYTRLTLADIPGLIDGAHDNVGLGHSFLKHIERTKVLVYVLDMAGTDGRDPVEDFRHLQNELELYQSGLTRRPSLIAANKMDAPEAAENLRRLEAVVAGKYGIIPVTAAVGELGNLKQAFKTLVSGS